MPTAEQIWWATYAYKIPIPADGVSWYSLSLDKCHLAFELTTSSPFQSFFFLSPTGYWHQQIWLSLWFI